MQRKNGKRSRVITLLDVFFTNIQINTVHCAYHKVRISEQTVH